MSEMSLDEIAKGVTAAQGAIHLLVIALIEKEAISAQKAVDVLEMLSSGSERVAKIAGENINQLRDLAKLEASGS